VNRSPYFAASPVPFSLLLAGALSLFACGCGSNPVPANTVGSSGETGLSFSGKVQAGAQPVSGASVQLYAASDSGYGAAGSSLLPSALITDSTGSFTVSASYPCASSSTQLYLIAKGGNPGLSGSANNSALWLMTAMGSCGSIVSGDAVVVNEVTTVASVAALAAFYSSGGNVGASSSYAAGLANAFGAASQLANMATGTSPGASRPPDSAFLPPRSTPWRTS
jgi:hypothetical protein